MIVPQSFEDGLLRTDEIEDIAAHVNGLPYTADGSLAVSLEGTVNHVSGGIPFDVNGRVCVGEGDPAWYLRGLAVTSAGRLCVAFSGDAVLHIGGLPATAAGAILANLNAAATFALDFEQDDYFGFSPAFAHTRATASSLVQQFDGSFVQMLANEWGREGGRRLRNLLNNTDTLATQGVTVEAADYWLSFTGTGSVAVSGVATDSLAGTGASDRVAKKVTMGSAGTATFTVTGSVTNAYLYKSRTGQTVADPEYVSRGVEILGDEKVKNGDFSAGTTDWTSNDSTLTVVGGALQIDTTVDYGRAVQSVATVAGMSYRVEAGVTPVAGSGATAVQFSANADGSGVPVGGFALTGNGARTASGVFTETVTGVRYLVLQNNSVDASSVNAFDNVTVKPIVHHGWGVDGVAWFKTDEYGNDLTSASSGYPVRAAGIVRRPAITNLCLHSNGIGNVNGGSGWNANGTPSTVAGDVGPFGVASQITAPATASGYYRTFVASATIGVQYTVSVYLKGTSGGSSNFDVRLAVEGAGVTAAAAIARLGTGEIVSGSAATARIESVPGWPGWYRVSVTATATSTGAVVVTLYGWNGGPVVFQASMIQGEVSSVANAFVPTTTASVTADADVITLDKDEIGYSAAGGVWVIEHTPAKAISANAGEQVLLDLYTSANERARVYNPSSNLGVEVVDDSVSQWSANDADANWVAGTQQRVAVRFVADDGSLVTDGTEHLTDASMTMPTVTSINLGGLAASKYSGTIERIAYYAEPV